MAFLIKTVRAVRKIVNVIMIVALPLATEIKSLRRELSDSRRALLRELQLPKDSVPRVEDLPNLGRKARRRNRKEVKRLQKAIWRSIDMTPETELLLGISLDYDPFQ